MTHPRRNARRTRVTGFDPARFLVVHGVDFVAWASRWGIVPLDSVCVACGRSMRTTVPIAQGSLRGLRAPPCECGDAFPPYRVVRVDGEGLLSP